MKIVYSNKWAPRNKFNIPLPIRIYYYEGVSLEIYIPELNIDQFYYRLVCYITLDEGDYFDEDY